MQNRRRVAGDPSRGQGRMELLGLLLEGPLSLDVFSVLILHEVEDEASCL